MDVPNLVLDIGQIRRDALSGRLSVTQLVDIIEKQQQTIKRAYQPDLLLLFSVKGSPSPTKEISVRFCLWRWQESHT